MSRRVSDEFDLRGIRLAVGLRRPPPGLGANDERRRSPALRSLRTALIALLPYCPTAIATL